MIIVVGSRTPNRVQTVQPTTKQLNSNSTERTLQRIAVKFRELPQCGIYIQNSITIYRSRENSATMCQTSKYLVTRVVRRCRVQSINGTFEEIYEALVKCIVEHNHL